LPSIICGINGGYIDHILNNINIFLSSGSIFFDPPIVGYALKAGDVINLNLPVKSKLSLIGIPYASVSTSGLRWELEGADLRFRGSNSCYNRTKEGKITISVYKGTVLVMIYLEEIQDAGVMTM
jgi:thiamine pyrophosphokinase